jgi:hypothetical protein
MYSTCLFCHRPLGANAVIEPFPVGRRLAFDAEKGRLWVVCHGCERWNLTPLEERWEAIEDCERRFRATPLRYSTDQIGLARLTEGLELVRIGRPLRPELAAWRYGEVFAGRRRRFTHLTRAARAGRWAWSMLLWGPIMSAVNGTGGAMLLGAGLAGTAIATDLAWGRRTVARVRSGTLFLEIRARDVPRAELFVPEGGGEERWGLRVHHRRGTSVFAGRFARRAAGPILARLNHTGAPRDRVDTAARLLSESPDPERFILGTIEAARRPLVRQWDARRRAIKRDVPGRGLADALEREAVQPLLNLPDGALHHLLPTKRLALEMALHEDAERRALEGDLGQLEEAWREAEEIARIADNLLLPESVRDFLARQGGTRAGTGERTT